MPWRREEVAPYVYDNVYVASPTEQFYYSTYTRTPEERQAREDEVNRRHQENRRNNNGPRY